MPTEKKYLQALESCVRNMVATEKDKDVAAELRQSIARLDKTDTLSESVREKKKLVAESQGTMS